MKEAYSASVATATMGGPGAMPAACLKEMSGIARFVLATTDLKGSAASAQKPSISTSDVQKGSYCVVVLEDQARSEDAT